ncbi:MAG: CBS domain-containing protein, partial [Jatrophihabitantaceae bacterium]
MSAPRLVCVASSTLREAVSALTSARVPGAPVVDDAGRFVGTVDRDALTPSAADHPDGMLSRQVDAAAPS